MKLMNLSVNQRLTDQEFYQLMSQSYDSKWADSATHVFYHNFWELLICEGGDDDLVEYDHNVLALLMAFFVTPTDIENYDNAENSDAESQIFLDAYHRIKALLFK